jgi:hypothetical protein
VAATLQLRESRPLPTAGTCVLRRPSARAQSTSLRSKGAGSRQPTTAKLSLERVGCRFYTPPALQVRTQDLCVQHCGLRAVPIPDMLESVPCRPSLVGRSPSDSITAAVDPLVLFKALSIYSKLCRLVHLLHGVCHTSHDAFQPGTVCLALCILDTGEGQYMLDLC